MKKLRLKTTKSITFEEGCNKYLDYCRQRNLREGTINHYRQSYVQFFKFFDPQTPIEGIDEEAHGFCYFVNIKSIIQESYFHQNNVQQCYLGKDLFPIC